MNITIWVAIIGGLVTLLAAVIGHFLNRWREASLEQTRFKIDRYKEFLAGLAELGSSHKSYDAHLKMANAVNTMNLLASKKVLEAVYALLAYISNHKDESYSVTEQDELICKVILAIRKDLGQEVRSLIGFAFKTISPGVAPGDSICRENT